MTMIRLALLVFLLLSPTACSGAEGTESSYCTLVSIPDWDTSILIQKLDMYAAARGLVRGKQDSNGILYGSPDRSFLINVLAVRKDRAEVALFPRVPGTARSETASLESFVDQQLGGEFNATRCHLVPQYSGGVLYGYDRVVI